MRFIQLQGTRLPEGLETGAVRPRVAKPKRKIKLGWEDLILGLALIIIVTGWLKKELNIDQVLAYLGFGASGGIWGFISGKNRKE